jgi:hypothetical protein
MVTPPEHLLGPALEGNALAQLARHHAGAAEQGAGPHGDLPCRRVHVEDEEAIAVAAHAHAAALPDGEAVDAVVLAQHPALYVDDGAA